MGNNIEDIQLRIQSTGWIKHYAYIPRKLTNGKWIWLKSYYFRTTIGLALTGFERVTERGDIFYMMTHMEDSIFNI